MENWGCGYNMPKIKGRKKFRTKAAVVSPSLPPTLPNAGVPPPPPPCKGEDEVSCLVLSLRQAMTSYAASHPECKEYAPRISKYLRNQFTCLGIKATPRRSIQKDFVEENGEALRNNRHLLLEFIRVLWEEEERDFQGVAVDLMCQFRDSILGETEEHFLAALGLAEHCVVTKSWWDTVDTIAYKVIGYFVKQNLPLGLPIMKEWIDHDKMWLRRVAILHQLGCKGDRMDSQLLFDFCLRRAHETEFFIRKAIGWALREHAKTDKMAVKKLVEENKPLFSALTIREALKHC